MPRPQAAPACAAEELVDPVEHDGPDQQGDAEAARTVLRRHHDGREERDDASAQQQVPLALRLMRRLRALENSTSRSSVSVIAASSGLPPSRRMVCM
jgi:hypothetical protein